MRILIVEDKIENLTNAVEYLRQLGHTVFYSVDLSGARKILQTEKLDGVMTDICFQENGINSEYFSPEKPHPEGIMYVRAKCNPPKDVYKYVLERLSISNPEKENTEVCGMKRDRARFLGNTSEKLREEVIRESVKFCSALGWSGHSFSEEYVRGLNSTSTQIGCIKPFHLNPALGYFVIKECMGKNIPVVFCTATGHAAHAIPAVLATGIITTEEYENTLQGDRDRDFIDRITITSGGVFTPGEKTKECWEKAFEVLMTRM